MQNVEIIILAGGKGTRMESEDPKPLTMLAEKPFLRHILDTIETLSLESKPVIVVGYKKERIFEVIGEGYTYAVQDQQLGTGYAVKCAQKYIKNPDATVVVLYADHPLVSAETIEELVKKQQETKSPIVMATTKVPHFEDWYKAFTTWGRIVRNSMGDISKNIEYKDATDEEKEIGEVNPCFFAFDGAWLSLHLDMLKNENAQKEYYLTDVVSYAFTEGYSIPSVSIPPEEAIGVNSKQELEILEALYTKKNKTE